MRLIRVEGLGACYWVGRCSAGCCFSGDDGVFHINKTSGCITLQRLPIHLKREIFNIKVRVS